MKEKRYCSAKYIDEIILIFFFKLVYCSKRFVTDNIFKHIKLIQTMKCAIIIRVKLC